MSRFALILAFALPPTILANPAGKEGARKETPAEVLKKALDHAVTLEVSEQPLGTVLQQLSDQAKATIVLDHNALFNIGDPTDMAVSLKAKDMKLRSALRSVTGQHGLSFGIVGDHILVSSEDAVNQRQLRQRVSVDLDAVSLPKALKDLAQQTATNVLVDPRAFKAATDAKVSLQLDEVPLETAVRIMSEMANLRPVRLGNVLFVTTSDRADRLKADADIPLPAPGPRDPNMAFPGGAIPVPALPPAAPAVPPPAPPAVPPMPPKPAGGN